MSLLVSIYIKKGVMAVVLMHEGVVVSKDVSNVVGIDLENSVYRCLLFALSKAMRMTRAFVQENSDCREVVFELNNSVVVKWIDRNYSKEEYNDIFTEVMTLLNELPIRYLFSYTGKPKAAMYADKKYVEKKLKMSGLDFDSLINI